MITTGGFLHPVSGGAADGYLGEGPAVEWIIQPLMNEAYDES